MNRRHRDRNREREPELTHLFKNNSFEISLCLELLYTSHASFFFMCGVSLTHPVLAYFLSGEFLLHIPCWLTFCLGSFSYTSRAGLIFPLGSVSYTSRAGFIFMWGFSLIHPALVSFLCRGFSYTSRAFFSSSFFFFF